MLDLKVIQLKDFALVSKAEYLNKAQVEKAMPLGIGAALPLIMRLTGVGFDRATDVIVNGIETLFSIQSPTTVLVTIPDSLSTRAIESILVLNDRDSFSNKSMFSFEVGNTLTTTSGISKAISQYVKVLLTTPGTDDFDKTLGGGLLTLPGSVSKASYTLLTKVALILVKTAEAIRQRQFNIDLPNDEKLQSVEVLSLDFVKGDATSIEAKVKLNTLARSSVPVALTLGVQSLLENVVSGVA